MGEIKGSYNSIGIYIRIGERYGNQNVKNSINNDLYIGSNAFDGYL